MADFVGEPSVDLFPGTARRGNGRVLVRVGDALVPADPTPSDGTEVVVGLRAQDRVATGSAPPERIHLFDKTTGDRLR